MFIKSCIRVHVNFYVVGVAGAAAVAPPPRRAVSTSPCALRFATREFNVMTPENDLKWQLIHPRAGADGYDFGPADAFVEFGQKHNMHIIGHTLA